MLRESLKLERVIYRLSKEDTRKALLSWLADTHNASFNEETEVTLFGSGVATVMTHFEIASKPEPTP